MTEIQLTSASAWKRQTWKTKLPSGNGVELRRPHVFALLTDDGAIPDTLFEQFFGTSNGAVDLMANVSAKETREMLRTMLGMAKTVVPDAIVSVRVITDREPNYDAGEINLSDVDVQDQIFIVTWAMQGGEPEAALARFLAEQQRASVHAAQGFPAVRAASVAEDGHREPADSV